MPDRNLKGAAVSIISIIIFILLVTQLSRISSSYNTRSYYEPKTTDQSWVVVEPKRY